MTCLRCGEATRVMSTRSAGSPDKGFPLAHRAEAQRVAGWYTPEWFHRKRVCRYCRARITTIELYIEDLDAMIAEKVADAIAKVKP